MNPLKIIALIVIASNLFFLGSFVSLPFTNCLQNVSLPVLGLQTTKEAVPQGPFCGFEEGLVTIYTGSAVVSFFSSFLLSYMVLRKKS